MAVLEQLITLFIYGLIGLFILWAVIGIAVLVVTILESWEE